MKKIVILFIAFLIIPNIEAAANLEVSAFSCSPNEVQINNQFSCTATVQNTGDATGTLTTATLYPDSSNWLENSNYPETVNANINSGSSTEITFNGLRGKKSGLNSFSKIMLDEVTDTYVASSGTTVNVINVIVTVSSSASSVANGGSATVTAQATVGGNADIQMTFSGNSKCSIGSQSTTATTNDMTDGQTTSHSWTVTVSGACSYTVTAKATSNPSGTTSKTDSASGSISCSNCASSSSGGSGGGGGGGGAGAGGGGVGDVAKHTWVNMTKGEKLLKIESKIISFFELIFDINKDLNNVELTVTHLNEKPVEITQLPPGKVYKYTKIEMTNINDSDINDVTVYFKVNKSWLDVNNINEDNVYLYRYSTKWDELPTTKVRSSIDVVNYTAVSPGFSVFAISGKTQEKEILTETPTEKQPDITKEEETPSPSLVGKLKGVDYSKIWLGIAVMVVIILIIIFLVELHRRKTA